MFLSPINGLHGSAYARCYKYFVPKGTSSRSSLLVILWRAPDSRSVGS